MGFYACSTDLRHDDVLVSIYAAAYDQFSVIGLYLKGVRLCGSSDHTLENTKCLFGYDVCNSTEIALCDAQFSKQEVNSKLL